MNIASILGSSYQTSATSSTQSTSTSVNKTASSASSSGVTATSTSSSNNSSLSTAVQQALVQVNSAKDLTAFFSSDSADQATSDFSNNLFANLPGFGNNAATSASVNPVKLDSTSASYQLQSGIQKLITQLSSSGSSSVGEDSGLANLQTSFNSLISKSGGDPSAQNLQSFLRLVAVNIQGSTSIGSIFSTSA